MQFAFAGSFEWLILVSVHCFYAERYTMRMIKSINKYLYGELGYKGATNYLDPDNSCINMVLKRREGKAIQSSFGTRNECLSLYGLD